MMVPAKHQYVIVSMFALPAYISTNLRAPPCPNAGAYFHCYCKLLKQQDCIMLQLYLSFFLFFFVSTLLDLLHTH